MRFTQDAIAHAQERIAEAERWRDRHPKAWGLMVEDFEVTALDGPVGINDLLRRHRAPQRLAPVFACWLRRDHSRIAHRLMARRDELIEILL